TGFQEAHGMDLGAGERPTDGVVRVDPHLVGEEGQDLVAQVGALGTDPGLPLSSSSVRTVDAKTIKMALALASGGVVSLGAFFCGIFISLSMCHLVIRVRPVAALAEYRQSFVCRTEIAGEVVRMQGNQSNGDLKCSSRANVLICNDLLLLGWVLTTEITVLTF